MGLLSRMARDHSGYGWSIDCHKSAHSKEQVGHADQPEHTANFDHGYEVSRRRAKDPFRRVFSYT